MKGSRCTNATESLAVDGVHSSDGEERIVPEFVRRERVAGGIPQTPTADAQTLVVERADVDEADDFETRDHELLHSSLHDLQGGDTSVF